MIDMEICGTESKMHKANQLTADSVCMTLMVAIPLDLHGICTIAGNMDMSGQSVRVPISKVGINQ